MNPLSVDEIEIEIEEIDGVEKEGVLRVYVMDFNNAKFEGAVSGNGKLTNLRCVAKVLYI